MNVIAKPIADSGVATNDLDRFRLRRFIESLAGTDELERRDAPVDLADIAKALVTLGDSAQYSIPFHSGPPSKRMNE